MVIRNRSEESGVTESPSQESGVRSQESGVRSQESGVRRRKKKKKNYNIPQLPITNYQSPITNTLLFPWF
ncbi:MAG: hypothetical protein HEQ31_23020 [Dolichospermum sp. OL03]|nr:hypothetical protein [Dolichospermum sp. OL01]MCO5799498.1 hypothetical protein [Dolichospermum sp. OL03]MCS6279412.1 hypothetical protein [Dolichospermum sp.]